MRTPTAARCDWHGGFTQRRHNLDGFQREYVSSIQLSGRALLIIVNDILDFSKIESGYLDIEEVPFNLCSIVAELCKLLTVFANQKNLKFTSEYDIDERLGLTISRNLATLMSGTIILELEEGVGSTATFTIPLKISSYCRLPQRSPVPSKLGFPFANHTSNTKPRLSRAESLPAIPYLPAISQVSVRQQTINQQISTSDTNHILPPYLHNAKSNTQGGIRFSGKERAGLLVLVVEDNAINQTIALKTIKNLGFQASAIWNGQEALNYLSNPRPSRPKPYVILMDVQMPIMGWDSSHDMDPLEVTRNLSSPRRAKDSMTDLKSPTMTASAIQGDRKKCLEAGMDGYLSKPVEKGKLEETLVYWAQKTC
ncbi:hypothetical protein DID88_009946 [Monilinia fructigena]|uniref:Response regulatory domain-containing protein n=1 Tax=Monilinia fructigena TaxID=38457 RepID=A0A395IM51_9HELO|nr:hypothetical protein DID88_009946 [Monilinia fructigena]